ncbi:proline--tRNA ligase [Clostridium estertheticum]|uniref:Proline--tRNA ligase n=1 Tax=Clostridium estertheticum subsp. estertheticum TaxID=1552 RepID=A0A1J0GBR9_9CLOT|nr:proline--tRNA ligase [Clostridium estertheticum]APC38804.1 proline--tRNA ligase [Clostridium estertheticum subsp. estertheticum]MBU3074581.1 proline--tRNA ligase [Clostridium estertheticum]MBU3164707.1 proline--tRNA ligase [Clostridium estertheticum]MBU3171313.1 proline--tRNA ligase [Clostridium estertheticum]MBU3185698.1 proline--tRNA ligase [Clostridium estertheticum]
MAKGKKFVESITSMDEDFAKWYTDIVKKAELADYASVRGCMVIRPYGYAIWENIQKILDQMFKDTGHENVYMPMFIPESLLEKEKDHVKGFAPEVAWVTHGGNELLAERLCVRPTSETLFCDHYSKIIQSYNDLPKLYNQWCSVVRWEKTTRPFLRSSEFLWQEGHTAHATEEEAKEETLKMLNIYAKFCEETLAIPVIKGKKTEKEKFAGANETYTIESLMHDGKALQCGTSHNFGDGFAKAFNIQYSDKTGKLAYVHQTSWGMSTRLIGALIMVHGDDNGLILPPAIAPIQLMIVPVAQHKEGVIEKATELKNMLSKVARVKIDISDKMPGWKFSEYEMKGVPLRLEVGPKDIEKNQVVLVRRDTREKLFVPMDELESKIPELLIDIQKSLFEKASDAQNIRTFSAKTVEELKENLDKTLGFVNAPWCGDLSCEEKVKEVAGASSRCMPFEQPEDAGVCLCCGKPAKANVIWGRAY